VVNTYIELSDKGIFVGYFAGGNWWNPKVGFSIPHSQCPCMDSQPDFGKNLPSRCHLLSKLTFFICTFTIYFLLSFLLSLAHSPQSHVGMFRCFDPFP
jgi:hypothetical protein